jgi:glucose/arabinose dehydrogenase
MLGRRFLLLVAVLMGLTALAASVAPRDPAIRDRDSERRTPTPAPSPAVTDQDAPTTANRVEYTISADAAPERVVVTQGDVLALEVTSAEPGSIMLMGEINAVDPRSAARFHVLADRPGKYDVTVVESARRIGTLEVRGNR